MPLPWACIYHVILIEHTPHKNRLVFFYLKIYTTHIQSLISITHHLGTYPVIAYQFQSIKNFDKLLN